MISLERCLWSDCKKPRWHEFYLAVSYGTLKSFVEERDGQRSAWGQFICTHGWNGQAEERPAGTRAPRLEQEWQWDPEWRVCSRRSLKRENL